MAIRHFVLVTIFAIGVLRAQDRSIRGTVTYVSSGTVYVSVGRSAGLQDSTVLVVTAPPDTVATIRTYALSSKSAACSILHASRDITPGMIVEGTVVLPTPIAPAAVRDTSRLTAPTRESVKITPARIAVEPAWLTVKGRISVQYYTALYDNDAYSLRQPGLLLSLKANMRDMPVSVEFYGNLRSLSRAGAHLFSAAATNESRIYRAALTYDDRTTSVTVGRILPSYAPSVGAIDGVSCFRRFGSFIAGASAGFQPGNKFQGISTETRKVVLFGHYEVRSPLDGSATVAYARSWYHTQIDREAVSLSVNAYTAGGISLYGYGDIDLRTRTGDRYDIDPAMSSALVMVNARIADFVSIGAGADASRPVYPYSAIRSIPDSMLDQTLRSGATLSASFTFPYGIGLYNAFTPRNTPAGFGREYANYSALSVSNILSSGTMFRGTVSVTENGFTSSRAYGASITRDVLGISCSLRGQHTQYRILQIRQNGTSDTFGCDVLAPLTQHLMLLGSVDAFRGYGSRSLTVYSELSWRF